MNDILVRPHEIDRPDSPAGRFREHRYGGGLIPAFAYRSIGTHCVDTDRRRFALTYDDGPDPVHTPAILDVLRRHGAVATFFVLADAAAHHPAIVHRIVDEGHEVALHGLDHRSLLSSTPREATARIAEARQAVERIAGRRVALYRPPYGEYTLRHAAAIRRMGLDLTIWSGDAHDWVHLPEDELVARARAAVFPGAVLLLHDRRADPETLLPGETLPAFDRAAVLDRILVSTEADGYATLTAGDLFAQHARVKTIVRERMRK